MTDTFSPEKRSAIMRAVLSENTTPELVVRKIVHRLGFRFRLHRGDLPGKPDLVLPRLQKVIFVHGCFWHQHTCKRGNRTPKTRVEYWEKKLGGNRRRDRRNREKLKRLGWKVLIVWECQTKQFEKLTRRLLRFLSD